MSNPQWCLSHWHSGRDGDREILIFLSWSGSLSVWIVRARIENSAQGTNRIRAGIRGTRSQANGDAYISRALNVILERILTLAPNPALLGGEPTNLITCTINWEPRATDAPCSEVLISIRWPETAARATKRAVVKVMNFMSREMMQIGCSSSQNWTFEPLALLVISN